MTIKGSSASGIINIFAKIKINMALAELAMIVAYSNMSAMDSFLFLKPLAELAKV